MFHFKDDWFSHNLPTITVLFELYRPKKVLEIGSHEGHSACAFLVFPDGISLTCVDPWESAEIKQRFDANIASALEVNQASSCRVIQGYSHKVLPQLIVDGEQFDFVYVDGSHLASDVFRDAVLAFDLCAVGGLIVFDDYLWGNRRDILSCPKPGIDAFTTCFANKTEILQAPLWQLYVKKVVA